MTRRGAPRARTHPAAMVCAGIASVLAFACGSGAVAQAPTPAVVARALAPRPGWPVRWPREPMLDAATAAAGLPTARREHGLDGRGATVCVVDSGIDVGHRDFLDADGGTRVRWLLDLTAPPRGEHPDLETRFGGAIWDAAAIDGALAGGGDRPRDPFGHGTAVASAAAGDDAGLGEPEPGPGAGAAPAAGLVVVRALRPGSAGFVDEDIAAGVDFCFAVAGRGPLPVEADRTVVVLGLGGHDGAHDGSEPLERALALHAEGGRLIVVAAGNDGGRPVHAGGWLREGERVRVPLVVPEPEPSRGEGFVALTVQVRTDGAPPTGGGVAVALHAPDGTATRLVRPGERANVDHAGGRLSVDGASGERGPGTAVLYAVVTGGGDVPRPLAGGRYLLELRGPASFDVWIAGVDLGATFTRPRLEGPFVDLAEVVAIPGTCPAVVTVGATTPRIRIDTDGGHVSLDDAFEGGVAPFSAVGPAFGGAPKPDLVAPGGLVVAALSSDVTPGDPESFFGGSVSRLAERRVGVDRVVVSGTSFAAPLVAGTLALALSTPGGSGRSAGLADRHLLVATARPLGSQLWSPTAGAGPLDALAFLDARADPLGDGRAAGGALVASRAAVAPASHDLWVLARVTGRGGRPLPQGTLRLEPPASEPFDVPVVGGVARVPVRVPWARPGAVLEYGGRVDDLRLAPAAVRVHLDAARDAIPPQAAGAGCAAADSFSARAVPAPRGAAAAFLLLPLLLRLRRLRPRPRRGAQRSP